MDSTDLITDNTQAKTDEVKLQRENHRNALCSALFSDERKIRGVLMFLPNHKSPRKILIF